MLNSRVFPSVIRDAPECVGYDWSITPHVFTPEECQSIIDWAEQKGMEYCTLSRYDFAAKKRISAVDIEQRLAKQTRLPEDGFEWFYDRLNKEVIEANRLYWDFNLNGIYDDPFILKYEQFEQGNGHLGWHRDSGSPVTRRRKLSAIVQLTDPAEYEGCDLQIFNGSEMTIQRVPRGSLITFPCNLVHRATPITAGVRYSIVTFIDGPPFR